MGESDSPLISVVILNWNGGGFVEHCLISLQEQTYYPLEIIMVDNASTDGSADLIKRRFPDVKLIVNERNLGFANRLQKEISDDEEEEEIGQGNL